MYNKTNFTLVRIDGKNMKKVSSASLTTLFTRMKANMESEMYETYRCNVKFGRHGIDDGHNARKMHRIYASVRLHATDNGCLAVNGYNGLLMLSAGPFYDDNLLQNAILMARILPCTLATFIGASGMTLKIIVKVNLPDKKSLRDEAGMERFFISAYLIAAKLYSSIIGQPVNAAGISDGQPVMMANCLMSADYCPYINAKAVGLNVNGCETVGVTKQQSMDDNGLECPETTGLIAYVDRRYQLRYNRIRGSVEFLDKDWNCLGWRPADERFRNGLTISARQAGLDVWNNDILRYLNSDRIAAYDPVEEWLFSVSHRWDGNDHIGRLADTVKTNLPQWKKWFRMWFVGMVAQWMGRNIKYANSIVPLFVSQQGFHKSTFCRSLLPPALRWGYLDSLQIGERKSVMLAMAENLLINLDEFNAISPKVQQGFLKNVLQLTTVSVKRPYARRREEQPRMASFIATSNMTDILSDPTGSRRFFVVKLTRPIDTDININYEQLYAQAVNAVRNNEQRWFDAEQTEVVMEHNRQYELRGAADMAFHDFFTLTTNPDDGEFMTTSNIFAYMRKHVGTANLSESLPKFGRYLANLPGIVKRTSKFGIQYLVKKQENSDDSL